MHHNRLKYLLFLLLPLWGAPAYAAPSLEVKVAAGQETVTLSLPGTVKTKTFSLSNPDRLVVDVPTMPGLKSLALPGGYKGKMIRDVRVAIYDAKTTRIVFDLNAKPRNLETRSEFRKGTVITIRLGVGKIVKKEDEKPIVVIDAGHGGQDPGTTGPRGTREKDVVLEYARALRKEIGKRYRVHLTRDSDQFILLRDRVARAHKAKGMIFISLHADSAPTDDARGLSVYTLSEHASDAEAEALAARENKVDILSGMDLSKQSEDVADILISLAQRDTNNKSVLLASKLVESIDTSQIRLLQNTHRFAGFAVLKAPDIPSVLVEIGFLSHPAEEKLLKSAQYREKVVDSLAAGIDAYFTATGNGVE